MKLGPVTKPDKRNTTRPKKTDNTPSQEIVTLSSFLQFMADLGQSRTWIPVAWSIILIFSLTTTFYLTKTKKS